MSNINNTKNYKQILEDIAPRYRLSFIYVFGSRSDEIKSLIEKNIRPDEVSASDIDIGVYYSERYKPPAREKVKLTIELEDLFESRVDLINLPEANAFLALDIIKGELVYCKDTDEQSEYELYVLRRAGDLAPFERARRDQILGRT